MSRALAAELFKLRTTRTNWGVALGSLGLVALISALGSLLGESGDATLVDLLEIAGLVQIFALVLGILMVTEEYRHGTITPSLLAIPDRAELVGAKLIAALLAGLGLGLAASLLCLALVSGLLSARGVETGGTEGAWEIAIGNTAASALFAAIGIGLGALLRNQVGAIIGALGWFFLVEPLLSIIPGFETFAVRWFPGAASNAMTGTAEDPDALGQLPAGLVLAAYAAAFVAAGVWMVRRRDVSA